MTAPCFQVASGSRSCTHVGRYVTEEDVRTPSRWKSRNTLGDPAVSVSYRNPTLSGRLLGPLSARSAVVPLPSPPETGRVHPRRRPPFRSPVPPQSFHPPHRTGLKIVDTTSVTVRTREHKVLLSLGRGSSEWMRTHPNAYLASRGHYDNCIDTTMSSTYLFCVIKSSLFLYRHYSTLRACTKSGMSQGLP